MEHEVKYQKKKEDVDLTDVPLFIVDDDPSYLYSLAFFLKRDRNYKIYCYTTAKECLNNLELKPKIVILDYFLSAGNADAANGMDVLKQIKRISPRIKVIMLSSQERLQVATDLIKSGAFTYVIKDTQAFFSIKNAVDTLCNGGDA